MKWNVLWIIIQSLMTVWNFYVYWRVRRPLYLVGSVVLLILNLMNFWKFFK